VVGLVAGVALLIFTDAPWTHALGVVGLLLCAVSVFALTATPLDHLPGPVDRASPGLDFDFLSVTWGSQRYGVCAKVTL